jgi:hypothetical protein
MKRTFLEEAAEFKGVCRVFVLAVAYSLKLDRFADWLANKLTKE